MGQTKHAEMLMLPMTLLAFQSKKSIKLIGQSPMSFTGLEVVDTSTVELDGHLTNRRNDGGIQSCQIIKIPLPGINGI